MDSAATAPDFALDPELARESWALVWLPAFAAPALLAREAVEKTYWGILWKKRGQPDFRWFEPLLSSEDAAMRTIQAALSASPGFVNKHQGGDFYCIPVRYCLRVSGQATSRRLRNLLIEFGLSWNLEHALGLVEAALLHGTAFPPRTAAWWRELLAGGVVVPVPVHKRVVVADLAPARREADEGAIL